MIYVYVLYGVWIPRDHFNFARLNLLEDDYRKNPILPLALDYVSAPTPSPFPETMSWQYLLIRSGTVTL